METTVAEYPRRAGAIPYRRVHSTTVALPSDGVAVTIGARGPVPLRRREGARVVPRGIGTREVAGAGQLCALVCAVLSRILTKQPPPAADHCCFGRALDLEGLKWHPCHAS
jgi:hypothetical protein